MPTACIDPSKSFYYYWTFAVYIGFLYNAMMCVIFVYDDTQGAFFYYWFAGNVVFDLVFFFDVIVNAKLSKFQQCDCIVNSHSSVHGGWPYGAAMASSCQALHQKVASAALQTSLILS